MLKKQTVWLLTMLSLMIVLSVYYMTSDSDDLAYIGNGDSNEAVAPEQEEEDSEGAEDANVEDIANTGQDELFASLRLEIQDERGMKKERLSDIVASASASTTEKDEALQEIDALESASTAETVIEETIMAGAPYEDVLVRSDEDNVHVHVKADELSKTEVVNIMQMVRDEFGEVPVDVIHETSTASK
ncbi:SpoIIIAH-like family protein [Lentibacillus sediminis]|uniref:SpoIIIAH-like family protein n=1 Tax=Lentibacillus sediminis TaxID=1940529 RepID=UPI000C1BA391|nr:SpoIIIAH-like family protein [Lentibacillus sediminis]